MALCDIRWFSHVLDKMVGTLVILPERGEGPFPTFYLLHGHLDVDSLFRLTEQPMIEAMCKAAGDGPAAELLDGLFGPARRLYKRVVQCSPYQHPELYQRLARRPYPWLVRCAEQFAAVASTALYS